MMLVVDNIMFSIANTVYCSHTAVILDRVQFNLCCLTHVE